MDSSTQGKVYISVFKSSVRDFDSVATGSMETPSSIGAGMESSSSVGIEMETPGIGIEILSIIIGMKTSCFADAGVETSVVGVGVETSVVGLGVETSIVGVGMETSVVGIGVETSVVGVGMETSVVGVGAETSVVDPGVETSIAGAGADIPFFIGSGVETTGAGIEISSFLGTGTPPSLVLAWIAFIDIVDVIETSSVHAGINTGSAGIEGAAADIPGAGTVVDSPTSSGVVGQIHTLAVDTSNSTAVSYVIRMLTMINNKYQI